MLKDIALRNVSIILLVGLLFTLSACSSNIKSSNSISVNKYAGKLDWQKITPLEFLEILKESYNHELPIVTIWEYPPPGWIKEEHVHKLLKLIDSPEPAAYTVSALSSYIPPGHSTVGAEATYLIIGFIMDVYPPGLYSNANGSDPGFIREWYLDWSRDRASAEISNSSDNWQTIKPLLSPKFHELMQIEGTLFKDECLECKAPWEHVYIEVLPKGGTGGIRTIRLIHERARLKVLAENSSRVRLVGYESLEVGFLPIVNNGGRLEDISAPAPKIENVFVVLQVVDKTGPYHFIGDYKIAIEGYEPNVNDPRCPDIGLTEQQVRIFFENAEIITAYQLAFEYDWLQCYAYGSIFDASGEYEWSIRPNSLGKLKTPDGEIFRLGCKECDERF